MFGTGILIQVVLLFCTFVHAILELKLFLQLSAVVGAGSFPYTTVWCRDPTQGNASEASAGPAVVAREGELVLIIIICSR